MRVEGGLRWGCRPEGAWAAALQPFPVGRTYVGNEFCARRLPSVAELRKAAEAGLPLTFLTPLVTDPDLERLSARFEALPAGSEVVFQDWGVLRRLRTRHPHLEPVLGRTLVRMLRDPRGPRPGPLASDLALPAFRDFLLAQGVRRVEVDAPRPDLPFPHLGLEAHLLVPCTFVASGRSCMIGSLSLPAAQKFRPGAPCRFECRRSSAELRGPGLRTRLVHRGNTALAVHGPEGLAETVARGGYSRVVYDPEAGF